MSLSFCHSQVNPSHLHEIPPLAGIIVGQYFENQKSLAIEEEIVLKHFRNKKSARERKAGKLDPSLARSAKTPLFRVFVSLQFSSSSSSYHLHPFAGNDILFLQSASWSNSKSTQPSVCRKICDFKCVLGSSTKYLLHFH